ncbi:MAG: NAD(P)-dependent oxidoreductase [Hafnia sp.]
MVGQIIQDGYQGATVAVTGASGFLGRNLVEQLLEAGARVSVLARDVNRLDPALAQRCTVVHGDLLNKLAMNQLVHGAAYVFHCAAEVATWGRWDDYERANVQGVRILLDALTADNRGLRRLVHVSTLDVYGFPTLPASEDRALTPVQFNYGESKRQGDLLVQESCQHHGISYVIVRPGNIVGPSSPFVSRIGSALLSGPMLSIDGGQHHAGLVDVANLVDVLLWAGLSPCADGQAYNVRDPWEISWGEYLRDFRAGSGLHGFTLNLDYRVAMLLASAASTPYRWFGMRKEPLLHPLIVEIFGRTCGHSIEKLRQDRAPLGGVNYACSLRESLEWLSIQPGFIKN